MEVNLHYYSTRQVKLHALAAFIRGKHPRHLLARRLGGHQSRSKRCGEKKNLVPLTGIEPQIGSKKTPWPGSASELYLPSDRRLSANLVPTFVDRVCHVVSVMDPYGLILRF
jgi:hypothetical protein